MYSAPNPPSSQSPSLAQVGLPAHSLVHMQGTGGGLGGGKGGAGGYGEGGSDGQRGPQSAQSEPLAQPLYSAPSPPSSQSPSLAYAGLPAHSFVQTHGLGGGEGGEGGEGGAGGSRGGKGGKGGGGGGDGDGGTPSPRRSPRLASSEKKRR